MKLKFITAWLVLLLGGLAIAQGQQPASTPVTPPVEKPVPLAEPAIAPDVNGNPALAGRLRTTALTGTPDAPVQNVRVVLENRSAYFYTFVSGWATFYDAQGVRCGEGMFKLDALAPAETAETDTPGLRLTCAPASWRIAATSLLARTSETATPSELAPGPSQGAGTSAAAGASMPPMRINIDGEEHPIQLNRPIKIRSGSREMTITIKPAP